jgi:hypothetical protein
MAIGYPYLKGVSPALVVEVQHLLLQDGSPTLASLVAELHIVDHCRCGDNFCATFYTTERTRGPFGPDHRTIPVRPQMGVLNVDVIGSDIVAIEVLYRDDLRIKIHTAAP